MNKKDKTAEMNGFQANLGRDKIRREKEERRGDTLEALRRTGESKSSAGLRPGGMAK